MHHSSYVHWAYPGEDGLIPSSRGSGILSLARLEHCALSHRLVLSVRQCIYARAPVTGTWPFHVATVGAPELRLVVGESTVRAATLPGIRAASSSTTRSVVLCYVYELLSESLSTCGTALFTELCAHIAQRLNLWADTHTCVSAHGGCDNILSSYLPKP